MKYKRFTFEKIQAGGKNMPLVTTKEMMLKAQRENYAIGAFNTENMEMVMAIIDAAEEMKSPVIVQTTGSTVTYANADVYFANVAAYAKSASVPIAMHLDHSTSYELAVKAMFAGYTSIMIDGSHSSFEDNIALTKSVVDIAKISGIAVEAELGMVGGKEDDIDGGDGGYTDPDQALEFAQRTGVDSLAIAIGTAHGLYAGEPKLDIERLKKIRELIEIPLVLHGASGVPDESVRKCIAEGICKVNFATELRIAYSDGIKQVLSENPDVFDPKVYGKVGMKNVKELVMQKMKVCGSVNKAI